MGGFCYINIVSYNLSNSHPTVLTEMAQNILVTFKCIDSVAFGFNKYAKLILLTQIILRKIIQKFDENALFNDIRYLTNKKESKTYKNLLNYLISPQISLSKNI